MNQASPTAKLNGVWVRLHLVAQTESSNMPPHVEGFLTDETPGSYVLSKVIELVEDEETFEVERVATDRVELINRTYVWRCSVLDHSPLDDEGDGDAGAFLLETGGMG
jgi:hypothetical protein